MLLSAAVGMAQSCLPLSWVNVAMDMDTGAPEANVSRQRSTMDGRQSSSVNGADDWT